MVTQLYFEILLVETNYGQRRWYEELNTTDLHAAVAAFTVDHILLGRIIYWVDFLARCRALGLI